MSKLSYNSAIIHVVAEYGVYKRNGRQEKVVLLVREKNNRWGMIGGGKEDIDNDNCSATARRECMEEMGVDPIKPLQNAGAKYKWTLIDDKAQGGCFKWILAVQAYAEEIEKWWGLPSAPYYEKMRISPPNCKRPPEVIGWAWIALSDLQTAHICKSDSVLITPNGYPNDKKDTGFFGESGIQIQLRGLYVTSPTIKYSNPYTVNTF